jgi:hypothetical protein
MFYLTAISLEALSTAEYRGKYGAKDFDTEPVYTRTLTQAYMYDSYS